ncbi:hypothetical protein AMJ39_02275 [candidate division TA06 bacterium DG_24]|uniref:dihydroneopterin aldolase n=3 Tax=Bacteria division TA06 TaxID=1156500 RepID=A0A0S8JNN2_UNCT6|nr:MAG: hypothetical protein AMJ39_02275 [candidate division TA06 bacterium DG_24]KPL10283.1 MAG: hypothetical protein AMJ71_03560 [candidate division TA06 bacterium SM1_40]
MTDRLTLRGMVCYARVGLDAPERTWRQPVTIDLDIGLDLSPAGVRDAPSESIDYRVVQRRVEEIVGGSEFQLMEALAETVARSLLKEFDLHDVVVRVGKPWAARECGLDGVEVEVRRRRADVG